MSDMVSPTGFWIFPYHDGGKDLVQLAEPLPAVFGEMVNRVVRLYATFDLPPGTYDIHAGVGPNPYETQQIAHAGVVRVRKGSQLHVYANIDVALPTRRVHQ